MHGKILAADALSVPFFLAKWTVDSSLRMIGDVLNDRVSLLIAEFFSLGIP